MEKLKTLKDLDLAWNSKKVKEILKAEAVKWVKKYIGEWYLLPMIDFFNLTEEDLA